MNNQWREICAEKMKRSSEAAAILARAKNGRAKKGGAKKSEDELQ
jgi:hypothetical protein